jgi:hypothetical protein
MCLILLIITSQGGAKFPQDVVDAPFRWLGLGEWVDGEPPSSGKDAHRHGESDATAHGSAPTAASEESNPESDRRA